MDEQRPCYVELRVRGYKYFYKKLLRDSNYKPDDTIPVMMQIIMMMQMMLVVDSNMFECFSDVLYLEIIKL